jgi:hypothetical protein
MIVNVFLVQVIKSNFGISNCSRITREQLRELKLQTKKCPGVNTWANTEYGRLEIDSRYIARAALG